MRRTHRAGTGLWRSAALAAVATGVLAAPVGAQTDPYGPPTSPTSTPSGFVPTIELSVDVGPVAVDVDVAACGYDPADQGLAASITFAGDEVASGVIAADGCVEGAVPAGTASATVAGELAAAATGPAPFALGAATGPALVAAGTGRFRVEVEVPRVAVGTYTVCSVVVGYPTPCQDFDVVAAGVDRPGGSSGSGALPRTGIAVAGLLALALVLVVAGRTLVSASRRRPGGSVEGRRGGGRAREAAARR